MAKELLKTCADIRKDLRCKPEITLRSEEAFVAQVGCQKGKLSPEVLSLAVPTLKPVNSKSVAEVVQSRSFSDAAMGNAAHPQESAKYPVYSPPAVMPSIKRGEENSGGLTLAKNCCIPAQACCHQWAKRYQTVFVELAHAHSEDAVGEVHVSDF
jgi:hypothetical protein